MKFGILINENNEFLTKRLKIKKPFKNLEKKSEANSYSEERKRRNTKYLPIVEIHGYLVMSLNRAGILKNYSIRVFRTQIFRLINLSK